MTTDIKHKQPQGLKVFCISVFFERYGLYTVQSLLILYLVKFFRVDDSIGYNILSSFIALSCIMPLIGGFIADKYLGLRRSIFIGAITECLGLILLIFPGKLLLYSGLAIVSIGVGLLKPSYSSLPGYLYENNDPRRDSGYTIFYIFINAGVILSSFLAGFIARDISWHLAFGFAALALVATYLVFHFGFNHYKLQNLGPDVKLTTKGNIISSVIILASVLLGSIIMMSEYLAIIAFITVCVSLIGIFIYCILKSTPEYKSKLVAFLILLLISIAFWSIYMQLFLSITLFIENLVNKNLFGIIIPTPAFIAIEAFSVVIFGYPLARLWIHLSKTKYNPSLPAKFFISMLILTLSVAILVFCAQFKGASTLINPLWICVAYIIIGIAELAISPIGLSMVNTLVPTEFKGMMTGVFILTIGLGGKIGGLLAQFAKVPADLTNNTQAITSIYGHAFNIYLMIVVFCTIASLILIPYIKKKIDNISTKNSIVSLLQRTK
ncbi:MAG: peptide MFS transporter [Gammaproteobacteria bacterium]|nr:peptide MFS transporter [Gammaproteobacteria bacterium]